MQIPAEDLDLMHRGKRIVDLDVKREPGTLLDLVAKADVVIDGFRPAPASGWVSGPTNASRSTRG